MVSEIDATKIVIKSIMKNFDQYFQLQQAIHYEDCGDNIPLLICDFKLSTEFLSRFESLTSSLDTLKIYSAKILLSLHDAKQVLVMIILPHHSLSRLRYFEK